MLWIVIALHSAWCSSTGAINLNPFSAFTDVGFEPMTEFSVNQGMYVPNTPSAIYPYLSEDSFSNLVGMPSFAGFKYPFSTFGKPLTTAGSSAAPMGFSGGSSAAPMGFPSDASTISKPKTGHGGKSQNSYVKNGNKNSNGYMNGNGDRSKNGQRSVTLDVRGGGYKLENSKSRPYKAPSVDSSGHEIPSQRRPSHGGRGNADSRTRNRRPNKKSQRTKGASMKNPYFNMKYETQPSSLPTNMEFESQDSVLPMVPSSLFYLRQQKSKLNPYLSLGSSADVLQSMMNYPFSPTPTFGGIKSMPSLYGSVKSAASQLLRGRASSALQSTLNSATLGALGFGFPFQSASGSEGQLANQLSLLQPSLEGAFGIAPPLSGDILSQDPSFYAALAQTAAGRNLLRQTYQQQMGSTKSSPTQNLLPFLQHQMIQQAFTPGLKLEPQTGNTDATSLSVGANPESLYGSSYTQNFIQGNQAGMHLQSGNTEPSQTSDYPQMLHNHQQQQPQSQLHEQHLQQQQLQQHQQHEHLQQDQLQQHQLRQQFQQQQLQQQQLQQQQTQQQQRLMNEKQTTYSSQHNFSPTYPEREQLTDQRLNIPVSTTTNSAQQAYTETQIVNKDQMNPYAHYPHQNPGANSYQSDSQRQLHEYSQPATSKFSQSTQTTYNDPNHGLAGAYQSDQKIPYSQPLNYPSQHHVDYMTNYPAKEQTENQQTSNPTYSNENAPQLPSYSPNLESLPAYPPLEYSNQMPQPNYQNPSSHDGISYPLTGSKQVPDYASNYASPEHPYYHQSATLQQNSHFGFPINVPGVQNISPPDPTNNNEKLLPSSTKQPDHKEGNDRAALHLPNDMSIFVSQNPQMKQAFEKLSGFYEQSKYYNPDSIKDSNENDDYSTMVNTRIQGEGLNSNQNDNSQTSSSEESKRIPTKLSLSSKSGNISTSTSYKLTSSDHVKVNKASSTSSYMIPFSPTDKTEVRTFSPSKPQSHSHTKTSSSRKSNNRKYHIPVPAKSSTESQARSSSVADVNEDTPFCARHANTTYCQHDPEYPRNEIKKAIEKNRHPLDHFLVDISPSSSLLDDASKSSSLTYNIHGNVMSEDADALNNSRCKSNAFYAKPLRAINTSGQWKVIVNVELGDTGTNYTQMVRFDECSHQDGSSSVCGLNPNASCLQQYKLYRLLAWDKSHGFFIDAFLFPISCACGNSFSIKPSAV